MCNKGYTIKIDISNVLAEIYINILEVLTYINVLVLLDGETP